MGYDSGPAHCATALVEVEADVAFDFLADPRQLGTWSLGCMRTQPTQSPDLFSGFSLYDDSQVWFDIKANRELLLVDYLVGTRGNLVPRISARVIPAAACDLGTGQCYVSLLAWRSAQMSEPRWKQLCAAHEAEIWLIKARIENGLPA
jgi:hypothetical protein